MRKLIEGTLVSLDGIVEGQEKWTSGYFDEEAKAHAYEALASVDTFLLGRGTFEKFSATWPNIKGGRGRRLFEDIDTSGVRLALLDIHQFKSGIVKHKYAVRYLA